MAKNSGIEWTQATWNPVTGCSKISDGCLNCYAEKMHKRLQAIGMEKYKEPFNVVRLHEPSLEIPSKTKKPTVFFVNSMSDLFHIDVQLWWIRSIWEEMEKNSQHIFLILTKRPNNIYDWMMETRNESIWYKNIWIGVTIESSKYLHRAETLQKIPAKHKFISFEPLVSQINLLSENLNDIDWVIVGGESGPKAREMKREWVDDIFLVAKNSNIPFFFKQWGSHKYSQHWIEDKLYTYYLSYKQFPEEIANLMECKKHR